MFPYSIYATPIVRKIFRKLPFWKFSGSKEDLDKVILEFLDAKSKEEIFALSKRMDELHNSWNVHSLLIWDERYPKILKEIYDPPLVLFVTGNPDLLQENWVAVVGTRKASPLSLKATEYLVRNFIPKDCGIVSGLALGIDRAAMIQSIEMGRLTLGVLGTSIEREYPFTNRSLYKKMKSSPNCILVSEYPPLVLFVTGNPDLLQENWVAVVGTRKASPLSLKATEYLVRNFIPKDCGIVSGLALGIDRAAMIQSIEMGRLTLGVLGTSIEREYPFTNRSLYKKMKSSPNCILVSEYLPHTKYFKWTFPMRNRVITGISEAVFLMEAPMRSGAISSAKSALQQNREIYVFNHKFQYDNSGGQSLIEEGATLLRWEEISPDTFVLHAIKDKVQMLKELKLLPSCSEASSISEWEYRGALMKLAEEGSLIPIGDELYCIFRR